MKDDAHLGIQARLDEMRTMILQIHEMLANPIVAREWFTVEEVATQLGKRPYTVREWCRHGRLNATKRTEKRGGVELWNISSEEVARYRNEGLLPDGRYRDVG